MRKTSLLFLLCLLLAGIGLISLHSALLKSAPLVEFTEVCTAGDLSAAEGLSLELTASFKERLFWTSRCRVEGGEMKSETDFRYYGQARGPEQNTVYQGLRLDTEIGIADDFLEAEEVVGLDLAYRELFEATAPGERKEKVIRLKDYCSFYPFTLHLDLPDTFLFYNAQDALLKPGEAEDARARAAKQILDFFRIPVLDEEMLEIHVSKSSNAHLHSFGSGSGNGDRFYMVTKSVYTKDVCYFSFNTHSYQGSVVDTSLIPGGYGIYALPYSRENGQGMVFADALSLVFPLDPAAELLELFVDETERFLYIHSREDGEYILRVVDLSDMRCLQRLVVGRSARENYTESHLGENYQVILLTGQLFLLEEQTDGSFRKVFYVKEANPAIYLESIFLYDGSRLALVSPHFTQDPYYRQSCGFTLTVYGKEGILYEGSFASSLSRGDSMEEYRYRCSLYGSDPLKAVWTS